MWTHPGCKLLFIGSEFGQTTEWNYKSQLDWHLPEHDSHKGAQSCLKTLNKILKEEEALYSKQFTTDGFEWVNLNHRNECIMIYKHKGEKAEDDILIILNATPEVHHDWVIETYGKKYTEEIFNSDAKEFDGTRDIFNKDIRTELLEEDTQKYRITLNIPPFAGLILK
jgi:1,4-alpha-glucan branching enzyme